MSNLNLKGVWIPKKHKNMKLELPEIPDIKDIRKVMINIDEKFVMKFSINFKILKNAID